MVSFAWPLALVTGTCTQANHPPSKSAQPGQLPSFHPWFEAGSATAAPEGNARHGLAEAWIESLKVDPHLPVHAKQCRMVIR